MTWDISPGDTASRLVAQKRIDVNVSFTSLIDVIISVHHCNVQARLKNI